MFLPLSYSVSNLKGMSPQYKLRTYTRISRLSHKSWYFIENFSVLSYDEEERAQIRTESRSVLDQCHLKFSQI